MTDNTPKEIQEKIEAANPCRNPRNQEGYELFNKAAEFGYQLAEEEIKALKNRIAEIVYIIEQPGGYHP